MDQKPEVECCEFLSVHEDTVCQVRENIPDMETLTDLADLFKLFGDPTRLKILMSLSQHELCVCDLAALIEMSQSARQPSAPPAQAEPSGKEPPRWQEHFLFPGRQSCSHYAGTGHGAQCRIIPFEGVKTGKLKRRLD